MRIALGDGAPAGIIGRIGGFHLNLALSSVDGAYSRHRHVPSRPESCSVILALTRPEQSGTHRSRTNPTKCVRRLLKRGFRHRPVTLLLHCGCDKSPF
ncbi:hypothetical protein C5O79_35020 [Burkholderia sp. SRS-25]|nr:hypothetical protein C5O79_35020 [Burkholderia sp. SRS-25]